MNKIQNEEALTSTKTCWIYLSPEVLVSSCVLCRQRNRSFVHWRHGVLSRSSHVAKEDLERQSASASQILGLQVCTTLPGFQRGLIPVWKVGIFIKSEWMEIWPITLGCGVCNILHEVLLNFVLTANYMSGSWLISYDRRPSARGHTAMPNGHHSA